MGTEITWPTSQALCLTIQREDAAARIGHHHAVPDAGQRPAEP